MVYEHEIQLLNASRDNLQASLKAKEAAAVAQSEQLAKVRSSFGSSMLLVASHAVYPSQTGGVNYWDYAPLGHALIRLAG